MKNANVAVSKFLSYILRHQPERIGLSLDPAGWTSVDALIECAARNGKRLTREQIVGIVEMSDKQRFSLSEDGNQIRANQGHSVNIDLGLAPVEPPEKLYHGTATRFLTSILKEGLQPKNRHHVHLSLDVETAIAVGQRHGSPAVLAISSRRMSAEGHLFYCSANGVWLTDAVPPRYLDVKTI